MIDCSSTFASAAMKQTKRGLRRGCGSARRAIDRDESILLQAADAAMSNPWPIELLPPFANDSTPAAVEEEAGGIGAEEGSAAAEAVREAEVEEVAAAAVAIRVLG